MEDSVPMQLTSSRIILPVPCPKIALPTALVAVIEIRKLETIIYIAIPMILFLALTRLNITAYF